jgi:hypothetical protein
MHINFAFEVISTVRAESPELSDADFEKQVVEMLDEAVDCERALPEDLLGQGVAGLSLSDMRAYRSGCRSAPAIFRNPQALRHTQSFLIHGVARCAGSDELLRAESLGLSNCRERRSCIA